VIGKCKQVAAQVTEECLKPAKDMKDMQLPEGMGEDARDAPNGDDLPPVDAPQPEDRKKGGKKNPLLPVARKIVFFDCLAMEGKKACGEAMIEAVENMPPPPPEQPEED